MKISSYTMNQHAEHALYRHEKTSFKSQLIKVRDYTNDLASQGEQAQEKLVTKSKQAIIQAKIQMAETLMAYLDKRPFGDKLISEIDHPKEANEKNKVLGLALGDKQMRIAAVNQVQHRQVYESESLHFVSTGQVTNAEGLTLDFSYDVTMHREFYHANSQVIQQGMLDPLVLNLDRKGVDFDEKIIHIDLDLDGVIDDFNMLSHGNGFLVLDNNNNGRVDDGSELFGPKTNKGFEELKAYDQDDNHWIDQNDLIFRDLKLWTLDETGKETLISLKDANIGAIYLGNVPGSFDFKEGQETTARISHSSIFLYEDGRSGGVHEILV